MSRDPAPRYESAGDPPNARVRCRGRNRRVRLPVRRLRRPALSARGYARRRRDRRARHGAVDARARLHPQPGGSRLLPRPSHPRRSSRRRSIRPSARARSSSSSSHQPFGIPDVEVSCLDRAGARRVSRAPVHARRRDERLARSARLGSNEREQVEPVRGSPDVVADTVERELVAVDGGLRSAPDDAPQRRIQRLGKAVAKAERIEPRQSSRSVGTRAHDRVDRVSGVDPVER